MADIEGALDFTTGPLLDSEYAELLTPLRVP